MNEKIKKLAEDAGFCYWQDEEWGPGASLPAGRLALLRRLLGSLLGAVRVGAARLWNGGGCHENRVVLVMDVRNDSEGCAGSPIVTTDPHGTASHGRDVGGYGVHLAQTPAGVEATELP